MTQSLRRSHVRHHHGKRLGIPPLQLPQPSDGSFGRGICQQLETAHPHESHNQAVRQHPGHLSRRGIKTVAEAQLGTI